MSEIYANTADQNHLWYIHGQLYPSFIKNHWKNVNFLFADDPNILEQMKHENPELDNYRKNLFNTFVTEKNKKYVGFYILDSYLSFFNSEKHYHLLCATGIQIGGGLSYLFIKGKDFEIFWTAFVEPIAKDKCNLKQEFYSSKWFPYFLSAYFINSEQGQVINDAVVFDNKKFSYKFHMNDKDFGDNVLLRWFKWFSQFYSGCKEYESNLKSLEW